MKSELIGETEVIKLSTRNMRLQSQSLPLQVLHLIGSRIVSGDLGEGETLPNEDELALELGVSRTVIREGIKMLTNKGLLEVKTRVGTTVLPKSNWNLLDADVLAWSYNTGPSRSFLDNVLEVRRSIEVTATELAAVRASEEDLQLIYKKYAVLEAALEDDKTYIEADMSFHEAIFKACHNELLEQIALTLRTALKSSRKVTVQISGSSRDALPLHYAVVQAITERDVDAARKAAHDLIDRSKEDAEEILKHSS